MHFHTTNILVYMFRSNSYLSVYKGTKIVTIFHLVLHFCIQTRINYMTAVYTYLARYEFNNIWWDLCFCLPFLRAAVCNFQLSRSVLKYPNSSYPVRWKGIGKLLTVMALSFLCLDNWSQRLRPFWSESKASPSAKSPIFQRRSPISEKVPAPTYFAI